MEGLCAAELQLLKFHSQEVFVDGGCYIQAWGGSGWLVRLSKSFTSTVAEHPWLVTL